MGVSWVVAIAIIMYREGGFVSCFNAVMPRRPDDWKWMKFYMRLRTNKWMNDWMNGWLVGWMNEWMCEWMPHGMCQCRRGSPRKLALGGRPNMLPIFNSWGSVAGVEGSTESGTSDFITTPRLLSCSALAFYCLIYSSSCCPPPTTKPKFDLDAG